MRAWLNSILTFIGAETLTDPEYESITQTYLEVNNYNQAAYDELSKILIAREAISTIIDNLTYLFKIKGLDVTVASQGKSTIYLGSVLE